MTKNLLLLPIGAVIGALSAIVGMYAPRLELPNRRTRWLSVIVASLTVPIFWWVAMQWGSVNQWTSLFFIAVLVVLSVSDLLYLIIPDRIVLPAIAVLFVMVESPFLQKGGDMLAGALLVTLIVLISQGRMGGGDIRLNGLISLILGWKLMLLSFFLASLLGVLIGGLIMIVNRSDLQRPIPFGPYLSLAALITLIWGQDWLSWYLSLY